MPHVLKVADLPQHHKDPFDRLIIALLVLSACETASGDNRATLDLTGVAIEARTRSTIASLWKVNDKATQLLMVNFDRDLIIKKLGKAESLKLAQQSLLHHPQYRSPYDWAAFVLVVTGNRGRDIQLATVGSDASAIGGSAAAVDSSSSSGTVTNL